MDYRLIRSRRKTIAICISRDGSVTVRAPLNAPVSAVEHFVREKQNWIFEKSSEMIERSQIAQKRNAIQLDEGALLPLLGKEYPILQAEHAFFDGKYFYLPKGNMETVHPFLIPLYQILARDCILPRVGFYSAQTGWIPAGVRIGSANTSWGSCSGKNRLNFTWKLVTAEPEVIDYVVVHELAHLVEHNHSKQFWKLVEQVLPDYRVSKEKLRLLEEKLQKIGLS